MYTTYICLCYLCNINYKYYVNMYGYIYIYVNIKTDEKKTNQMIIKIINKYKSVIKRICVWLMILNIIPISRRTN